MNSEQIDAKAQRFMMNGVTNIQIGRMALAANSHIACHTLMASIYASDTVIEGSNLDCVLSELEVAPQEQDLLHIGFDALSDNELDAIIFPKDDLVILVSTDEFDLICSMSVSNFFRYLNSIPNPFLYANQEKYMVNATPEGIYLLSEFCENS